MDRSLTPFLRYSFSSPGRADVHIEYKLASVAQAIELFKLFYPIKESSQTTISNIKDEKEEATPLLIDAPLKTNGLTIGDGSSDSDPDFMENLRWDLSEVEDCSARWGDLLPEREFSVAQLQGRML